MADILKIVFIILGILIIYVSYWLLSEALFPRCVDNASRQYSRPFRITLTGLAVAIVPVVLGIVLSKTPNPILKFIGITFIVVPGLLGLVGSAGLTLRIGRGLPSPSDETQPWLRVLRGGIVLAFSFLLPFVGWIIIPLWVLVSGLGAFILAVREEKTRVTKRAPLVSTTFATANQVG
jgi:uncharacterized membrane protein